MSLTLTFACHCGFMKCSASECQKKLDVLDCNCSMCKKKGFLHLIVPESRFTLVSPSSINELGCYSFNTHVAKHYFCPKCGICAFYRPRSNPDGFSINYRCIEDDSSVESVTIEPFDGQNWESNASSISHLSK